MSRLPAILLAVLLTVLPLAAGCSTAPPTAPDADPLDPGTPVPASRPLEGRFAGAGGHRGAGGVRLSIQGTTAVLEFDSTFAVSPVPGPFVYLNTTNDANTGAPLRVSALQRNTGAQRYAFSVPPGPRYSYVLVWCDPFNVPVADAVMR